MICQATATAAGTPGGRLLAANRIVGWLQGKGISQRNAVHALRKECGSLIASNYGIEAAREHLGHRDIRITSSTYVSKKRRVEVSFPPASTRQLRALEG